MSARTIGNFQLIEMIGEGGMGEVYRGLDTMLEREVAIKTLRPELGARPELVERFRVEAIALAKLNHPNIAAVYSFFRDGNQHHMAMQFVRGETLEKVLARRGRLDWKEVARIGVDVLQALEHAHALGVIHRDLKPGNLMLESSGRTVVMDFGIARVLARARQTRSGTLVGTLEYIAPELIKGVDADGRADLYSLGVVLYELATGRLPFEGNTDFELMRAHTELEPPAPERFCPDLPPAFSTAILRALAKQPDQRFASAREFLVALAHAAGISTTLAVAPAAPGRAHSQSSPLATVQSGWKRAAAAFADLGGGKGRAGQDAERHGRQDSQGARLAAYARKNPGVAVAAVAGVVAAGFAGAGAYQAITKPSIPTPAVKPAVKPQPVVVNPPPPPPKVEPVEAKGDGIYRMPDIPKAVVSIEGPGAKPPAREDVSAPPTPPPPPPPVQAAPQPVTRPPAPPRPQPTEVAKPAPKPPATPPTTVAAPPAPPPPPPPPPARKDTPPTPADSGWNIRR